MLHSGIYSRELASSLAAGAVIVAIGFFLAGGHGITAVDFAAAIFLFAVLFVIFRLRVFREPMLETVFDPGKGIISISRRKVIGNEVRSYPMAGLSGIGLGKVTVQPENIDGIKFVEKIALQHGTVIPGFGKKEEIYTVRLDFGGRVVTIFSTKERSAAEEAAAELKRHVTDPGGGPEA